MDEMKIFNITDKEYANYGRVLTTQYQVEKLKELMEKTDAPTDDVIYVPSDAEMEATEEGEVIKNSFFGGMPIQIGYCNGTNKKLNALEYHRCSEFGVACTDLILLLGRQKKITSDNFYDTDNIKAFFVPAGTVYEMYATTLHYAPCSVNGQIFRNVVVLPKGTNEDLTETVKGAKEDPLLFAVNKWLIAHEEANIAGAFNGLLGTNLTVE